MIQTILPGLFVVLPLLAAYVIYVLFLKPFFSNKYYSKQGCNMSFFPVIGMFGKCFKATNEHGDFYYPFKNIVKHNPSVKALGSNLFSRSQIYLVEPSLIKEFLQNPKNYTKSQMEVDLIKIFTGDNLITTQGDFWKRHRRIISSVFHFDFLKQAIPDILEITTRIMDNLKDKDISEVEIIRLFESITGEVVGRVFFGEKFSDYKLQGMPVTNFLAELSIRVATQFVTPAYLMFGPGGVRRKVTPRFKKIMNDIEELHAFAKSVIDKKVEEIKARKENENYQDSGKKTLIEALLEANDGSEQGKFTPQEIIDEFVTFFVAGMDTTAHLVGMAVYHLSQNPQYKARLLEEVDKYFKNPSEVTLDDLNQMEFTTAFIKETLRMSPPASILMSRVAKEDHQLGDLKIKKDTILNISILANNFNSLYHDNPESFDPERWITDSKTKQSTIKNPYVFIPFSSGPSNCIGQHLAMNEGRVIFSLFLKKFDFVLSPTYVHKMTLNLTYEPANKLNFRLIPRENEV